MNGLTNICLYGTRQHGAGWLAQGSNGRCFGDGNLKQDRSFTEAVWLACAELREAGYRGNVRIFEPKGRLMADTTLEHPGSFGDLKWRPATMIEISAEALIACAAK